MFIDLEEEKALELVDINTKKGMYTCTSCGSSYYYSNNKESNKCIFCNSLNVNKKNEDYKKYDYIIPFNKTLEEALKDYKKKIIVNPFIPFTFRLKKNYSKIEKIYIPTLLSNIGLAGDVSLLAGDKEKITKDKEKYIETKKYKVLEKVSINYKDLLFTTYSKLNEEDFSKVGKYDYRFLQGYDEGLLNDIGIVIGDIQVTDMADKVREKIKNHSLNIVKDNVHHQLIKTEENNLVVEFHDAKEVLVPIYLLTIDYKNKKYQYMMNGQTGSSVLDSCFSIVGIVLFSIIVFSIILLISFIVAYYL